MEPGHRSRLPQRFGVDDVAGKAACKAALQREVGLPVVPGVPLFGAISRLAPQKGFDVLAHALESLLAWELQIVLLGSGDQDAERFFAAMSYQRGDKFRAYIGFDDGLAHRIEAGSDFFLMPSRFEPCGLNQMYSLRYGALPIVRATGGLIDTIQNYDEADGRGTGFMFGDLTVTSLTTPSVGPCPRISIAPPTSTHAPDRHEARLLLGARGVGIRAVVLRRLRPTARPRLRAVAAPSLMANGHHADCSARPLKVRVTTGVMFTIRRG